MGKVLQLFRHKALYTVVLSIALSVVLVAVMVSAATTISTNVNTGGTLTVTGISTLTGNIFATSSAIVTGQIRVFDQLVLNSAAANPTGDAQGALYYNTANRVIRMFNGSDWFTVASSTDANGGLILGGSNLGVRFNTIATAYMALGTTTLPIVAGANSGSTLLNLNSTTTATVPLLITGVGGQTGDLIRATNGVYTKLFGVDALGNASTTMLSTSVIAINALTISGYATTSGSTGNFATEGTLTVTGASSLNGAVTLGTTVLNAITINGNATTTGSLNVQGVFSVRGVSTTTVSTVDAGFATTTIGINTESSGGSATVGIGTTTPMKGARLGVVGDITAGSTVGTTTLRLGSSQVGFGSCIEMRSTDGAIFRIYATTTPATGTPGYRGIVVEAGTCE